jgi:hypothetical protein
MSCASFEFVAGSDYRINLTALDEDGEPLDLTGYTIDVRLLGTGLDVTKTTGAGVTHATQSGATIGLAEILFVSTDTDAIVHPEKKTALLGYKITAPDLTEKEFPPAQVVINGRLVMT